MATLQLSQSSIQEMLECDKDMYKACFEQLPKAPLCRALPPLAR